MKPSDSDRTVAGRAAAGDAVVRKAKGSPRPFAGSIARVLTAVLIFAPCAASAANRTVTNLNDSGAGSLRDTIAAADSGDEIRFAVTGTITLTGGDLSTDKSLTIAGPGAPSLLHITRSNAPGTSPRRIIQFLGASLPTVRLSGLTLSQGRSNEGGGAISAVANLSVINCLFHDNTALQHGGGAIYHDGGGLEVSGCVFRNNFAANGPSSIVEDGGAILTFGTNAGQLYQNSIFEDNRTDNKGGAISIHDGSGTITYTVNSCAFISNRAASGGAIDAASIGRHSTFNVVSSDFYYNQALQSVGGACSLNLRNTTISRSVFYANGALRGGAVFTQGSIRVENSTLVANSASSQDSASGSGGGIFNLGFLVLDSCTFTANSSFTGGGTIHQGAAPSAQIVVRNNIFNHYPGSAIPNLDMDDGSTTSFGYNLWSDASAGPAATDLINTDPQLDVFLSSNGGPTRTVALLATSPALDRGHRASLTTDQRGFPRPWDLASHPAAAGGDHSDIGAYETRDPIQVSPIIVNTLHDHDDGTAGAEDCTLREALKRGSLLHGTVIRFAPELNGTISLDNALGPLTVEGSVSLEGPGARILAVSAGNSMRVLQVDDYTSFTISGLTIRDGRAPALDPGANAWGGGILNDGTLTLINCALTDNVAAGAHATGLGNSGGIGEGGGIYNSGTLTVRGCTFRDCLARGGNGTDISGLFTAGGQGGNAAGGAIFNKPDRSLSISNCTFWANRAYGGDGGDGHFGGNGGFGHGGAVCSAGTITVTSATVVGNTGLSGFAGTGTSPANNGVRGANSGGLATFSPALSTVRNTISAGNSTTFNVNEDVFGDFVSQGYNLIGSADGSTGFTHATDQTGTDAAPLFSNVNPLKNNGGPCDTMVPTPANAGIDKGRSFGLTTDQRGIPRPLDSPAISNATGGDGSDIGAAEADIPQSGPEFVVNSLDDHDDLRAGVLDCTLREAINAAAYTPGANTVSFAPGLTGTITLTLQPGLPAISESLTITGPGARRLTISGNNTARVFNFTAGSSALSGLTIRNGTIGGELTSGDFMGGGVLNQSTLTVSDCTFAGNTVTGGDGATGGPGAAPAGPGGGGLGGGIANAAGGSLTLRRCTFTGNSATGGAGGNRARFGIGGRGGDGRGGGVFNAAGGTLTIQNCTLHGNIAAGGPGGGAPQGSGGDGGNGQGAAVFNLGMKSANSLTVTANVWNPGEPGFGFGEENNGQPGSGGGALFSAAGGSSMVRNTISSSNLPSGFNADAAGVFNSSGFNLIADPSGSTGFCAAGDQTFADPRLGPLQNNGGPGDTCAPLAGSQALDRGHSGGLTHDQRLQLRPWDNAVLANGPGSDGSDIGALEVRPPHTGPPEFILIETTAAGLRLCVQGAPFTPYQLHRGGLGNLVPVPGAPVTSDGLGLVEFTDAAQLPERRFYQVRESP